MVFSLKKEHQKNIKHKKHSAKVHPKNRRKKNLIAKKHTKIKPKEIKNKIQPATKKYQDLVLFQKAK